MKINNFEENDDDINIKEFFNYLFNSIENIENFSIKIYRDNCELYLKKIPKKNLFYVKIRDLEIDLIESFFDKIEEIDMYGSFYNLSYLKSNYNYSSLDLIEDSSLSRITKVGIYNQNGYLNIPIKSFKSLNIFKLYFPLNSEISFPLFSKNSLCKFPNLEYLEFMEDKGFEITDVLIENLDNIPNIRYLAIINPFIFNCGFPYHKKIISKCLSLIKLHTLIIESEIGDQCKKIWHSLDYVEKYYSLYPELKKTNIRYCRFSKLMNK